MTTKITSNTFVVCIAQAFHPGGMTPHGLALPCDWMATLYKDPDVLLDGYVIDSRFRDYTDDGPFDPFSGRDVKRFQRWGCSPETTESQAIATLDRIRGRLISSGWTESRCTFIRGGVDEVRAALAKLEDFHINEAPELTALMNAAAAGATKGLV